MNESSHNVLSLVLQGGTVMIPLLVASVLSWVVILERWWVYRRFRLQLGSFHLQVMNALLSKQWAHLKDLLKSPLPTAQVVGVAVMRLDEGKTELNSFWKEAAERKRQLVNQDMKRGLWILGSVATAAPFIGLFGTVVGILQSFGQIAQTGKGGFSVVAGGISEALIATAAGIVVAVIAVVAFNALQTRWQMFVLVVKVHSEEILEVLAKAYDPQKANHRTFEGNSEL